jgi:outer membrane protein
MKKITLIVLIACGLAVTGNEAKAQTKIGYIRVDDMVELMPEIPRLDTLLQKFQVDSIGATYNALITDYTYKDSLLHKNKDSLSIPATVREQYRRDLEGDLYQIQNWNSIGQQMLQNKQAELYGPVYTKVITALKTVAKEKGYTYVLSKEAFLVAPDGDDLLPMVAAKLGVKLPNSGGARPPATKP